MALRTSSPKAKRPSHQSQPHRATIISHSRATTLPSLFLQSRWQAVHCHRSHHHPHWETANTGESLSASSYRPVPSTDTDVDDSFDETAWLAISDVVVQKWIMEPSSTYTALSSSGTSCQLTPESPVSGARLLNFRASWQIEFGGMRRAKAGLLE